MTMGLSPCAIAQSTKSFNKTACGVKKPISTFYLFFLLSFFLSLRLKKKKRNREGRAATPFYRYNIGIYTTNTYY